MRKVEIRFGLDFDLDWTLTIETFDTTPKIGCDVIVCDESQVAEIFILV